MTVRAGRTFLTTVPEQSGSSWAAIAPRGLAAYFIATSLRVASSPEETSVSCELHGQACIAAITLKFARNGRSRNILNAVRGKGWYPQFPPVFSRRTNRLW
jgi:hypothetical protein